MQSAIKLHSIGHSISCSTNRTVGGISQLSKKLAQICFGLVFCIYSDMAYASTDNNVKTAKITAMPLVENLQSLGQQALNDNLPIAILFAAKGLKSTERLKDEAIIPALMSGQLNDYVHLAEIHVNSDQTITDFYGEPMQAEEFKALYNLTSLPVMVFVDGNGDQIIPPLLSGAYDYYFHYLKLSINDALKALDNPKQIPLY